MLVILGKLYLHPINETHQFRPTLTYLDILSRKNKRTRGAGSDSDSDDGPPPDPDEVPVVTQKKDKKTTGEAKEVHVSARKSDDQGGFGGQGSMSAARREILHIIRVEEDEQWQSLEFCNVTVRGLNILLLCSSLTPALRSLLNHLTPSSPFFLKKIKSCSAK